MIKCTLNDKEVEVTKGTSIIQAFRDNNMEIAHYCWHPGLSVAGVCRLCMVEIEGNPRLQIACNTPVQEGMVISNQSDKVKDAVKWGLDFHLINHPLDCPICDQAGECGLQNQYMKFGTYDPEMAERKVKKRKVVDLGELVVLDSERCILCSRCVRFTEEVSKTNELGIFNRGDHSEIGTYQDKPLDNNYSVNTVDICPVGALTSKDFRFEQRVWLLKDKPSVCNGCSTGCNIDVYYNKEGVWRVKPRHNPEVNGYWMCDKGRDIYKNVNPYAKEVVGERGNTKVVRKDVRVMSASKLSSGNYEAMDAYKSLNALKESMDSLSAGQAALVVTGQYGFEEIDSIVSYFVSKYGKESVFHWQSSKQGEEFDGILYRGADPNPNTKGLEIVFGKNGITGDLSTMSGKSFETIFVAGPENQTPYTDMSEKVKLFASSSKKLVWLSSTIVEELSCCGAEVWQIPMKSYMEKSGTFINYNGIEQKFEPITSMVNHAFDLSQITKALKGEAVEAVEVPLWMKVSSVANEFVKEQNKL